MLGIERMHSDGYNRSFVHVDWRSHKSKIFAMLNMGGHVEEPSRVRPVFDLVTPTLHASPTLIGVKVEESS